VYLLFAHKILSIAWLKHGCLTELTTSSLEFPIGDLIYAARKSHVETPCAHNAKTNFLDTGRRSSVCWWLTNATRNCLVWQQRR